MNASPSPMSRLVRFLIDLNARALGSYAGVVEKQQRVHFWSVGGRPVLIQETRDGGYDLFVPLLDSLDIGETERALRAYAQRSDSPADGRSSASAIEAPESAQALPQGTLDARNAESPSETNLAPNAAVLTVGSDGAENSPSAPASEGLSEREWRAKIGASFSTQVTGSVPFEDGRCDVHRGALCPHGRIAMMWRRLFHVRWQTPQMSAPAFATVCYEALRDWEDRGLLK